MMDGSYFIDLMGSYGYLGMILGMMLEGIIIIIPSEVILAGAGILVSQGIFTMQGAIIAGVIGSVLCASLLYGIGYFGGRPFVEKYGKYFFINATDLAKADRWFLKHGMLAALFGRCFPIIRTFISIPIGISRMDYKKFILYTTIGSIPWTATFVFIGYKFGENYEKLIKYVDYIKYPIIIILLMLASYYVYKHLKKNDKMI